MYYISSNRINIKKQQTCPFKMAYIFFSFQAKHIAMNYWYLVFEEPGGTLLYITAAGGGQQVTVQVSHS